MKFISERKFKKSVRLPHGKISKFMSQKKLPKSKFLITILIKILKQQKNLRVTVNYIVGKQIQKIVFEFVVMNVAQIFEILI